jgi:hypothetical protein
MIGDSRRACLSRNSTKDQKVCQPDRAERNHPAKAGFRTTAPPLKSVTQSQLATAVANTQAADVDAPCQNLSVPQPRVHLTRYHGVLGPHYKHREQIVPKQPEQKVVGQEQDITDPKQLDLKKKSIPRARLLARVFNFDFETCIKCSGNMKIIAAIEDSKVIRKILEQMGLDTKPPLLLPARDPPKVQHHFENYFAQQYF